MKDSQKGAVITEVFLPSWLMNGDSPARDNR
jgi:hypothetical protein